MLRRPLLILVLVFTFILSACQSAATITSAPPTQPAPVVAETDTYPYPLPTVEIAPANTYPEPDVQSEPANWSDVPGILKQGEVTKVIQARSLNVYLTLKDGRTLKVTEPSFDDITRLIVECGEVCQGLTVENP